LSSNLSTIRCFLLDMDGTFYLGNHLLPGAQEFLRLLENRKVDYLFLTNNSSKSRLDYVKKLHGLGVDIPEEKIFTSGEATALWLKGQKPGARLYLVGTPALELEFRGHGFDLTEVNPDYAVLGFDTTLTYNKLWRLCDLVKTGIKYIATHPDINCPTETGFMPDIGAMIEFVAASTGRRPDIIIGKPYQPIVDALSLKLSLPIEQICMIGDRLYTDIALGKTGLSTILVFSGETSPEDLLHSEFHPNFVFENLADLVGHLEQAT
jgi:4-nitrophenyl phosphatase